MDGIVFINLAHRKDRLEEIRGELERHRLDAVRIEGIFDELNGARGCALSHIKALDYAVEQGWKNVLVLEDDCLFSNDPRGVVEAFLSRFEDQWDVFFLGGLIFASKETPHEEFQRVVFSVRAHAYIVNTAYISKLRENFAKTVESMQSDFFFVSSLEKSLDRQWADLQKSGRWFAPRTLIAEQRKSFSDIEKGTKVQR